MGIMGTLFGGSKNSSTSSNKAYDYLKDSLGGAITSGGNFLGRLGDELSDGFEGFKRKAGFDFQLGQGMRGITGTGAASGLLRSGGTGRALVDYGNNLQSGMYGNYLDRLSGVSNQGLQAAGILAGAGQESTSKGKSGNGLVSGLTSIFSDRRLKQDVRRIGTADNGLPIYAYAYTNDPARTHIGFMADEVELVRPDAVSEFMGYQTVDYGKAVL